MKETVVKLYRNTAVRALAIALLLCFAYTESASHLKFVRTGNLKTLDLFFRVSNIFLPLPKIVDDVVVISLDDESFRETGLRWPWPRGVLAGMIKRISEQKPALICLDIMFLGKSADRKQDLMLAKATRDAGCVFAASYVGDDLKYTVPDKIIADNVKSFGLINKPRDPDNKVRRLRLFKLSADGKIIDYSLAVKVAAAFLNLPVREVIAPLPLLKNLTAYIYFFGNKKSFKAIPAWKVLKGMVPMRELEGKMVFMGITSEAFHDIYQTPLGPMPGVYVILNEVLTFLTGRFFYYAGYAENLLIMLVFVFIATLSGLRLPVMQGAIANMVEIACFFALGYGFFSRGIVLDAFGPIFLIVLVSLFLYGSRYVVIAAENARLRKESATDGLTQLYVYRYFELQLRINFKKALKEQRLFALIIFDIDHFKRINDTYGHEFGNEILRAFAWILKNNSRKVDTVARYGGEEFCVLAPGMKNRHVLGYTERIREKFKGMKFGAPGGGTVGVTVSAGIVTTENFTPENYADFIRAADSALYKSKKAGRDRITVFGKNDRLV